MGCRYTPNPSPDVQLGGILKPLQRGSLARQHRSGLSLSDAVRMLHVETLAYEGLCLVSIMIPNQYISAVEITASQIITLLPYPPRPFPCYLSGPERYSRIPRREVTSVNKVSPFRAPFFFPTSIVSTSPLLFPRGLRHPPRAWLTVSPGPRPCCSIHITSKNLMLPSPSSTPPILGSFCVLDYSHLSADDPTKL